MIIAQLATAATAVRLTLHVLAASVWVGGQLVVAGLLPTIRSLGPDAAKKIAQAFGRLQWPAYAVLVLTGLWNVSVTRKGQGSAWQVVLGVKITVVALAGLAAFLLDAAPPPVNIDDAVLTAQIIEAAQASARAGAAESLPPAGRDSEP